MPKWPWLLRAVYDPVTALDLRDKNDNPDHSKIIPWMLLVVAVVFHALGMPFTWWELTTLGSLAFGHSVWRQFLASRNVTGSFNTNKSANTVESITRTFTSEGRDPAAGIDPTGD